MAAYDAELPRGCSRTIYLCDDGKDPKKRKWCDTMGPEVQYVSGRKRPSGEMNGKSGNLNNVVAQMYPEVTAFSLPVASKASLWGLHARPHLYSARPSVTCQKLVAMAKIAATLSAASQW